jgi:hypothetical protein
MSLYFGTYERLGVHIYASSREVLRAANRMLAPRSFTRDYREARHTYYRLMLAYHEKARDLAITHRL